jgi:hypothetical protein
MNIQDDIKALHNHEHFARFVRLIHQLREEAISELHEVPVELMQQISGRIITYDQVLQMADWPLLQSRFQDRM